MITRHLEEWHLTIIHEAVTGRRPAHPTAHRPLRDGELTERLDGLGVPLSADERDRPVAVVGRWSAT